MVNRLEKLGQMLTIKEVSLLLHVHGNTLRRWADQGLINAYRINRRGDRRFRREDIVDFLTKLNENTTGNGRKA